MKLPDFLYMIQACNQKYRKILFQKILSYLTCSQIWLNLPSFPVCLRFAKSPYTKPYVYYTGLVWYGVLYELGMYSMGGGGGILGWWNQR
jgi:hypothetical protein